MSLSLSPAAISRGSARRPWLVVGLWGALFVTSLVLITGLLPSALTTSVAISSNPDSRVGRELIEERLHGPARVSEAVVIRNATLTVDDPAYRAYVEDIYNRIGLLGPEVTERLTSYYRDGGDALVSADRRATLIPVTMAGDYDDASENVEHVVAVTTEANGQNGFEVYVAGYAGVGHDFNVASAEDIVRGETIGGLVALAILLVVFGAVVAALVPVVLAVMAIVAALGLTALVGQVSPLSFFAENMITMMGLAVGIDYSLFLLSRFREERARGRPVLEAVDIASSTAGRAVLFSGITVIIALMGMLILPSTLFRSLAGGAIFAVFFAILASLTLLPALMRLLGDNVDRLRLPFVGRAQSRFDEERSGGFWDRVATTVMRHPVIAAVGVSVVLIALALPYLDLNAGSAGVSTLPDNFQSKKGFMILQRDFAGGQVYPAEVVIDGDVGSPAVEAAIERLRQTLASDTVFGPATFEANPSGDLGLLSVQMATDPYKGEANAALKRLRDDYIPEAFAGVPARVLVAGETAFNVDAIALTDEYTPIVLAFVLGLSFLLLMIVFRSIVVPAKAILMNLLSVGAAYGLIVLVSQKGFGADILGFQQVDTVEFWLPLFLFSVLFGLSMDYHVFLLSRIRERYDETNDNTDAVAFGLRSTGRLITGAALIMVAVFGGFAMGSLIMLQQVGFGLAVAVLIDATIIRSVLVPATMKLLGRWNWYLPPVLRWLPHVGVEDHVATGRYVPERVRQT